MTDLELVLRRDSATQYTASLGGRVVGNVQIAVGHGVWEIYRTVVDPAFERRGIASRLVRFALADAEAAGVRVIPSCWYVEGLMQRHPEFAHLRVGAPRPAGEDPSCRIAPSVVTPHS